MCSGSVATIKDLILYNQLKALDMFSIQYVYSKSAKHFSEVFKAIEAENPSEETDKFPQTWLDEKEWEWSKIGDPVVHINLRKWADLCLIAPLSCNTMAKIANGMSDNL